MSTTEAHDKAIQVLVDLAENANDEAVRMNAAATLLASENK